MTENDEVMNDIESKVNEKMAGMKTNLYKPENSNVLETDIREETLEEKGARHARNDYTREYNEEIQRINTLGEDVFGRTQAKGFKIANALEEEGFLSSESSTFIKAAITERNGIEHRGGEAKDTNFQIVGKEAYEQTKKIADEVEKKAKEVFGTVGSIDNLLK